MNTLAKFTVGGAKQEGRGPETEGVGPMAAGDGAWRMGKATAMEVNLDFPGPTGGQDLEKSSGGASPTRPGDGSALMCNR